LTIIDSLRQTATRLLARFAVPVEIERVTRFYSAATRSSSESRSAVAGRGVLTRRGDTERVEAGEERRSLGAVVGSFPEGFSPVVDDVLVIGGRRFRISGSTPVQPDGSPIIFLLALDRA
jgi:hypothetical protein